MPVVVAWQAGPQWVADEDLVAAVDAALAHGGRAGLELSLVLVDDATLARMHGEWLGDPTPTDVISFDLGTDLDGPAGEVYASAERAARVAAERGLDPARELLLYVVHGVLHLCGFDDGLDEDRARMRAAERSVLATLGHPLRPEAEPEA